VATQALTAPAGLPALVSGEVLALSKSAMTMLGPAKWKAVAGSVAALAVVTGFCLPTRSHPTPVAEVAAPAPPPAPAPRAGAIVTGQLSRIGNGSVTLVQRGSVTVAISTNPATLIRIDDRPANLADLREGMDTAVVVQPDQTAREVRAYTSARRAVAANDP
jgi:hypothetical protein